MITFMEVIEKREYSDTILVRKTKNQTTKFLYSAVPPALLLRKRKQHRKRRCYRTRRLRIKNSILDLWRITYWRKELHIEEKLKINIIGQEVGYVAVQGLRQSRTLGTFRSCICVHKTFIKRFSFPMALGFLLKNWSCFQFTARFQYQPARKNLQCFYQI